MSTDNNNNINLLSKENDKLLQLLKDFTSEQKVENDKANRCFLELKDRLTKIEVSFKNCSEGRQHCYNYQADMETRLRKVETNLATMDILKELPKKFDALALKVYTVGGAMSVIMILIAIWLKK